MMTLSILPQGFSVCKVDTLEGVDLGRPFLFLARTDDELSLVCETAVVPEGTLVREDGWRALKIIGPLDFGMVGVIARISGLLAEAKISLFVVSTYDTDYVLIKDGMFDAAVSLLRTNAYQVDDAKA